MTSALIHPSICRQTNVRSARAAFRIGERRAAGARVQQHFLSSDACTGATEEIWKHSAGPCFVCSSAPLSYIFIRFGRSHRYKLRVQCSANGHILPSLVLLFLRFAFLAFCRRDKHCRWHHQKRTAGETPNGERPFRAAAIATLIS